jgi:hypothetical protein
MLGFFPTPYPDELLHSVCARYASYVDYPRELDVIREVCGVGQRDIRADLPSFIGNLVCVLPVGHCYTIERLIDEYTLMPLYQAFLPKERGHSYRRKMSTSGRQQGANAANFMKGARKSFLHICPLCAEEDRESYGAAYWHRLHQVPGVEVCHVHKVFLQKTEAQIRPHIIHRKDTTQKIFLPASQITLTKKIKSLNFRTKNNIALFEIAKSASWLLSQVGLSSELNFLRSRYLSLLFRKSYLGLKGQFSMDAFSRQFVGQFNRFFGSYLLADFRYKISPKQNKEENLAIWVQSWLDNILSRPERCHPSEHLLLIHLLGCRVQDFFDLTRIDLDLFKPQMLPCPNKECKHFQKPVVNEAHLRAMRYSHRMNCYLVRVFCPFCKSTMMVPPSIASL